RCVTALSRDADPLGDLLGDPAPGVALSFAQLHPIDSRTRQVGLKPGVVGDPAGAPRARDGDWRSVVGAGGRSSLMAPLASATADMGMRAVATSLPGKVRRPALRSGRRGRRVLIPALLFEESGGVLGGDGGRWFGRGRQI